MLSQSWRFPNSAPKNWHYGMTSAHWLGVPSLTEEKRDQTESTSVTPAGATNNHVYTTPLSRFTSQLNLSRFTETQGKTP